MEYWSDGIRCRVFVVRGSDPSTPILHYFNTPPSTGATPMEFLNLGRSGLKVSRLCLGTMMFGGPTDEAESTRIIHRALDTGINFIDTADVYNDGESERITGKAIAPRRAQVVLATKVRNRMGPGPNDAGLSRR